VLEQLFVRFQYAAGIFDRIGDVARGFLAAAAYYLLDVDQQSVDAEERG
jgi:hypothetical protein